MTNNLKIFHKLAISYFLVGLLTVLTISIVFYWAFKKALIERTSAQLSSINILKKTHLENYFKDAESDLEYQTENPIIHNLFLNFKDQPNKINKESLAYLEKTLMSKELLLLDNTGNINYYTAADTTFAILKFYQKTITKNLALQIFFKGKTSQVSFFDATRYFNSGKSIVLVRVPIIEENAFLGSIIFYKNFSDIEKILFERSGMGESGESYIVASDTFMRSPSRFYPDKIPSLIKVATPALKGGLSGIEREHVINDYRGIAVLSAYRKLNVKGLNWVVISEIDYQEALLPVYAIRNYIIITGVSLMILILLVTLVLSRKISGPIMKLKETVLQLSKGKLPTAMHVKGNDEIAEITMAISQLIEGLKRTSGFAFQIGNGNFKAQFDPLSVEDTLGLSLIQMRDKLKLLQQKESMLMRERSSALLEGQEKERRRIAMELHDGIGQMLTVIRFKISALDGNEQFQKDTKSLLDDTIAEVRRISNNVMPNVLLDFGLISALKTLCSNTQKYTNLQVNFEYSQDAEVNINFESSVSLYRIAQEALNNAVKYSNAEMVNVELKLENFIVSMEIEDDGEGFDIEVYYEKGKLSNGIKNMQERVRLLQGTFKIVSVKGSGTKINVEIPMLVEI